MARDYYVYILTNADRHTVLYIGVTNDLRRRVTEHREKRIAGFTARYNVSKLVYFETFGDPTTAIEREKQLKDRSRKAKLDLIARHNPAWRDLYDELLPE